MSLKTLCAICYMKNELNFDEKTVNHYKKLYDYKKVHILMGKYDIPTKNPSVVKHCQEEYGERFETIFITRDEMILLLEKIFDIKINMPPEMIQGTMQEFE